MTDAFSAAVTRPWSSRSLRSDSSAAWRGERVLNRTNIKRLGFVDQRTHDIDLSTGTDLGANDIPDPILGGVTSPLGVDRCPARRVIEHRHVEIAVDRHRRSARNRGGGHDQDIRRRDGVALLAAQPLLDTETVLLVDDDDPESGVFDLFLDQGACR